MLETADESRRVSYGGAVFLPKCPKCGRYVRADSSIMIRETIDGEHIDESEPNATCAVHGRIAMPFEGWFSDEEWN